MTVTPEASMGTHLAVAATSGVLIGRHSSVMASSIFMQPGSAVFELLPFKWEWANISMLYYNITQSMGDIHHFAWRANHYKWADYTVGEHWAANLSFVKEPYSHRHSFTSAAITDVTQRTQI